MKMYGLKTCDTCRKALRWAAENNIEIEFIDVREGGMSRADIARFIASAGWETALNRKSTTWRSLDDGEKAEIDGEKAQILIERHPALLKRPVFDLDGGILVGFNADIQARLAG